MLRRRPRHLVEQPVAPGADLRDVAARLGIDQPVALAILRDEVERLNQAPGPQLRGPQRRGKDAHPLAATAARPSICCELRRIPGRASRSSTTTPASANHCRHQISVGSPVRHPQQVLRLLQRAGVAQELRTAQWCEAGRKQAVRGKTRPGASAMADGGINLVAREVHQLVRGGQPQRKCRVRELEAAEPRPQPIGGDRMRRTDPRAHLWCRRARQRRRYAAYRTPPSQPPTVAAPSP